MAMELAEEKDDRCSNQALFIDELGYSARSQAENFEDVLPVRSQISSVAPPQAPHVHICPYNFDDTTVFQSELVDFRRPRESSLGIPHSILMKIARAEV